MAAVAANSSILPDVEEENPDIVPSSPSPPVFPCALLDPLLSELPQQPYMDTSILSNSKHSTSSSSSISVDWETINEEYMFSLLSTTEGFKLVTTLQGTDAITAADFLDNGLDSERLNEDQRTLYIAALRRLCGKAVILPTSHIITDGLRKTGDYPNRGGGFTEVWEGKYKGQKVAIKTLKVYQKDDMFMVKRRLYKEAVAWKHLSHPNLLTFLGVRISRVELWLVSPWMTHGNLNEYVMSNPRSDRVLLFRDIVNGLGYLHSKDIIHGDLKGPNILIRGTNQACLADFGLITIVSETIPGYSMTTKNAGGTVRWMAPELLDQPSPSPMQAAQNQTFAPTKQSDVYALGLLVYEVITGTIPFSEYTNLAVIPKVLKGHRPKRPKHPTVVKFVDALWPIAEACWCEKKEDRLTIIKVQEILNHGSLYSARDSFSRYLLPPLDGESADIHIPDVSDLRPNANQRLPAPHFDKPTPVNRVFQPENVSHSPYWAHINDADHSQKPNIVTSAVPQPNGLSSSYTATAVQNNIPKSVESGGAHYSKKECEEEKKSETSCGCCVIQ